VSGRPKGKIPLTNVEKVGRNVSGNKIGRGSEKEKKLNVDETANPMETARRGRHGP